jgi:predicted phosphodiesterase
MHLSDLHIDSKQEGESKPVFLNLCKKIEQFRTSRDVNFDLLIVSGDLVDKGSGDYSKVEVRLKEILNASGLNREQIFLVPGNHDIVWAKYPTSHSRTVKWLKEDPGENLKNLENDEAAKKDVQEVLQQFLDFSRTFPLHIQKQNVKYPPGFCCADLITASQIPIRLCGLNTALVVGRDDYTKKNKNLRDRVAGTSILSEMLDSKSTFYFIVSHYPLSWIHPKEQNEIRQRLQQNPGTIYFNGHIHEPKTDIMGVQHNTQLLVLGAGSLYGQRWGGRNHCQILELNSQNKLPLLHEWFWFGEFGWRAFEPIEINWRGWELYQKKVGEKKSKKISPKQCHLVGLVDIKNERPKFERIQCFEEAVESAAEKTDFVIVGRSLIDWSYLFKQIESAINEKSLHVKIALLDENSIFRNFYTPPNTIESWIEKPIPADWAINDVRTSMEHFRRIHVQPNTGSLEIYGLSFYPFHSFVAYSDKYDQKRYCSEEVGMALTEESRPFIQLKAVSDNSYASFLEKMYTSLLTPERMLLSDDGLHRVEKDKKQRAKIITNKIDRQGLVDLSVGRSDIDWVGADLAQTIKSTQEDGEIFVVGRSLVIWGQNHHTLADVILKKRIKCTFVIADPTIPDLKSLVFDDYSQHDLKACWENFKTLNNILKANYKPGDRVGSFELYGIPAYVPDTFSSYTRQDGVRYCNLEAGIGVEAPKRTTLYFQNVSDDDIYSSLNAIYRGILKDRKPLLKFP